MSSPSGLPAPRWAWWIATGLGSGHLRPAPGTWGSLAGLVVWLLLALLASPLHGHGGQVLVEVAWLGLLAGLTLLAVRTSAQVAAEMGREDPGCIVIDEWVGIWIALHPLRWLAAERLGRLSIPSDALPCLGLLALAFAAFRLFDIWKPWPCHAVQDLPGGQGIVADDLVAGLYAALVTLSLGPALFPALFRA